MRSFFLTDDAVFVSFKNGSFSRKVSSYTQVIKKAMGHSSINVSLTYLRGLEIAELKGENMT